ncbi:nucleolar protein 14-like [Artemia franciscana]|uniref:nucleolar protein 14-like n=1 Tax=Artemia franciscana TaxID=6661 RepID=UPI0032DA1B62
MVNIKKNKVKKGLSDKINRKKNVKPIVNVKEKVSTNPFEVKINRKKFDILGRKLKEEKGLPGVARQKAVKKRQETLLPMLKDRYKTNKFIDKRLGEGDTSMTLEDKMMARFAAERAKTSSKKALFSLEDVDEDTILTHRGQSLAELERYDDPRSDEDDEENSGRLGSSITESHFGGGLLSKKEGGPTPIEQLIADSKKRKDERQKLREETEELTEQLDSDFKSIAELLGGMKRKVEEEDGTRLLDAYDKAVKQLKFEARGQPSDKLRTADEIAKEEAERLKRLEEERQRRMNPDAKRNVVTHVSADALDDSYWLPAKKLPEQNVGDIEENDERDFDDDQGPENDEDVSDESAEDEEENGEMYSDLESEEEVSEADEPENKMSSKKGITRVKTGKEEINPSVPYVVKVPESYEDLVLLLCSYTINDQSILLERMLKCNHPTLSGENKAKAEVLFKFLIQLAHDIAEEAETENTGTNNRLSLLPNLNMIMFEIINLIPMPCCTALREVISEHFDNSKGKKVKTPIPLNVIIFLKIVGMLCPASDFKHPVTTPALILCTQLLENSSVTSFDRVARGLMLSAILVEYISLSKRYLPELYNFLLGVIVLAEPKKLTEIRQIPHPFRSYGPDASLLVINENCSLLSPDPMLKLSITDLNLSGNPSDVQKMTALNAGLNMMCRCLSLWSDYPSFPELASAVSSALDRIPLEMYPEDVKKSIANLKEKTNGKVTRKRLVHPERKPKILKLFEPKFEESYDGRKKHNNGNPAKFEQQKLTKQYKREMKGAIREIRRDSAFIARSQLKEELDRDVERKEKVKKLLGSLAMQEGDFKRLKRNKK